MALTKLLCVLLAGFAVVYGEINAKPEPRNEHSVKGLRALWNYAMTERNQDQASMATVTRADDKCEECIDAVNFLRRAFNDSATIAEIAHVLEPLCSELPGDLQVPCRLAMENLPLILSALEDAMSNPKELCKKSGLCQKNDLYASVSKLVFMLAQRKYFEQQRLLLVDPLGCDVCVELFKDVKSTLSNQTLQSEVIGFVKQSICSKMPATYTETCKNLTDELVPQAFAFFVISVLEDPRGICAYLGECPQERFTAQSNLFRTVVEPKYARYSRLERIRTSLMSQKSRYGLAPTCAICEVVANTAIEYLENNDVVLNKTVKLVEKEICDRLPSEIQPQCLDFLEQYGVTALKVALDNLDAGTICKDLRLCTSKQYEQVLLLTKEKRSRVACEACQKVKKFLESELEQPEVQKEAAHFVESLCYNLPRPVQSFAPYCASYMGTYTPYILQTIAVALQNGNVCKAISVC